VLLDASPVATSAESVDLARLADGVVLVARRGSARPEDLDAAVVGLRTVGTPLIGSVFTFAVGVPPAPVEAQRALPPGRPTPGENVPASEPATVPARQPRIVRRGAAEPTPNATSAAQTPSAASTVAVGGVGAHVGGRVIGVRAAQPAAALVEKHHAMPSWIGSGARSALQERPSTRSRSDATGADRVVTFPTPYVRSRDDVPRPTGSVAPLGAMTRASAIDPAVQRRVIGAAADVLTVRHGCGVDAAYALILERARNTGTPTYEVAAGIVDDMS
jgi:ANTAR domain-containing protein